MDKKSAYDLVLQELESLIDPTLSWISVLGNVSALLKERFSYFSWVGFYLYDGKKLILGPFQGKVACETIELNRGVCGSSATTKKTIIVPDVHMFPGHIACDESSNSEIVIPLLSQKGKLLGVLDVDSNQFNSFDNDDAMGLEKVVLQISSFFEKSKPNI